MAKGNRQPRTEEQRERARQKAKRQWADPDARAKLGDRSSQRKDPPPDACERVTEACAEGATILNVCAMFNISRETWYKWVDTHPEIAAAFRHGRGIEQDRILNQLFALGMRGNVTACIFLLKSKFGFCDNGGTVIDNKVQINFQLPGALKPEEYLRIVTARTEVIPPEKAEKMLDNPKTRQAVIRQLVRSDGGRDASNS